MDISGFDWALVRSFLAVIDSGSLLGAARQLRKHQPTVSRQVAQLESQLGVPLFERTGRGLVPTSAGLRIVDAARAMAAAAASVRTAVERTNTAVQGTIRISCSQVVATYLMPPLLIRFRRQHPDLQVDLVSSNAVSNLLRREADLALRLVRPTQSSLTARRIGEMSFGAFASRNYLKRHPAPTRTGQLLTHELVGLDSDESQIQALRAAGVEATREHFSLRTDDQVAAIEMVRQGAGIGFLPHGVARNCAELVPVLESMVSPKLPMWLVVHREIQGSARVRAAFDFLAGHFPKSS